MHVTQSTEAHDTYELDELKRLWIRLMPKTYLPQNSQWLLWVERFGPDNAREGILHLAEKFHRSRPRMGPDHMVRFASSVMSRRTREGHGLRGQAYIAELRKTLELAETPRGYISLDQADRP